MITPLYTTITQIYPYVINEQFQGLGVKVRKDTDEAVQYIEIYGYGNLTFKIEEDQLDFLIDILTQLRETAKKKELSK